MLPEIALTTQIIERLQKHFGASIGVYHSRLTPAARQDVWRKAANGSLGAVLGVRSSLFLPFKDLGLIIVDEEHDSSYKQYDPAPRYHARDAAMMLSRIHGGVTLLGSATPSVESYHNATVGRYGLVELTDTLRRCEDARNDSRRHTHHSERRKRHHRTSHPGCLRPLAGRWKEVNRSYSFRTGGVSRLI